MKKGGAITPWQKSNLHGRPDLGKLPLARSADGVK